VVTLQHRYRGVTHWTVVSHPGPVEREILEKLAPNVVTRRHVGSGVTLRALHGGPAPGADHPAIVFLHGRGHAASTWAPILGQLAPSHAVLALDLPGFGHSASRPWSGGDARAGLALFAEPIGRTLAEIAGPAPIVVGHSLGGAVAIATVLAGHVAPRALVLIGSMGLAPRVRPSARLYYATDPERVARWREPMRAVFDAVTGGAPSPAAALRRELLTVRGGRPDAAAAFRAMCPLVGEPFCFDRAELASIRARTMLLWGDRDEAFPLEVALEAERTMPAAEVRVVAAGHSPHVEKPDVVARIIEELAASLAGP
jgi:pimeloyl-ACP methyl ester carboxylesterase